MDKKIYIVTPYPVMAQKTADQTEPKTAQPNPMLSRAGAFKVVEEHPDSKRCGKSGHPGEHICLGRSPYKSIEPSGKVTQKRRCHFPTI